jgi:hypothetical protein
MKQNNWLRLVAIAALGATIACGAAQTPTSPASASIGSGDAGASGETLKVGAPTPTSPIGGVQLTTSTIVLNFGAATGSYATISGLSYQIELKNPAGTVIANPTITTTSYTVTATTTFDTVYSWRVRATYQGAVGPWSSTVTFKTQVAAFISGNTLYDPLTTGLTVGTRNGSTTFIAGQGLRLNDRDATNRYNLPTTLDSGEFSMMILGADEGAVGSDKSKVFSMQEGSDDITTNDYRMTAELRGADYGGGPGAVTCRIITGNNDDTSQIHDCTRLVLAFNSSRWYFWSFTWNGNSARLKVQLDNEAGATIYSQGVGFNHAYRPTPHTLWLGAPVGRAGNQDATISGGPIYKNVYAGPTARPSFPALLERFLLPGGGN